MAVLADLINKVRRRVHDYNRDPEPLYDDDHYSDAFDIALSRVNLDLSKSWAIGTIPDRLVGLLVLRATIEMCVVRAGEGASADVTDVPEFGTKRVEVPNLTVENHQPATLGASVWLELMKRLDDEYQRAVAAEEEGHAPEDEDVTRAGDIETAVMVRRSPYTGRMMDHRMVRPLPARTVEIDLSDETVTVTWNILYHTQFSSYLMERSPATDPNMRSPTVVARIGDNHTDYWTDNPGSGRWYYRVVVSNLNNLRSPSEILSVDVP